MERKIIILSGKNCKVCNQSIDYDEEYGLVCGCFGSQPTIK
jgi:hypothetical protein